MTRVKRGNVAHNRRKKILKLAKGFRGSHSKLFRIAKQQVFKSLKYSYTDRKNKKIYYRRLWIIRINAYVRMHDINYSKFMSNIKKSKIAINRKMLAQLAIFDNESFNSILNYIK
uniref:Large ribosomal subunit protein bL20c n=1 Tax=Platysiphonia delicata TaxID=2006979 RepID=A0A1Z1M138_9FLOR|nr:ribosomal protein L20 [Platysiphonia delicata]ARW59602.1 ribosomal protein L20 [Platysiphonia delicata]